MNLSREKLRFWQQNWLDASSIRSAYMPHQELPPFDACGRKNKTAT